MATSYPKYRLSTLGLVAAVFCSSCATVPVEHSATEIKPRCELVAGPFVCEHCAATKSLSMRWSPQTLDQLPAWVNTVSSEEQMVKLANHEQIEMSEGEEAWHRFLQVPDGFKVCSHAWLAGEDFQWRLRAKGELQMGDDSTADGNRPGSE